MGKVFSTIFFLFLVSLLFLSFPSVTKAQDCQNDLGGLCIPFGNPCIGSTIGSNGEHGCEILEICCLPPAAEECNPVTGKNCYYCYMNPVDPLYRCLAYNDFYPPGSGMGTNYQCSPGFEKDSKYCATYNGAENEDACNDPGNLPRTCVSTGVPIDCDAPNQCVPTLLCPSGETVPGDCGNGFVCCTQGLCGYCDDFGGPICREAPEGSAICEFDSLSDCDASGECVPGGLFGYNCVNNSCELAPIGESDYVSEGACILDGCERHSCVNKNCVPDPDGNFDTLNLCQSSGCDAVKRPSLNPRCNPATGKPDVKGSGINSAIGCIPFTNITSSVEFFLRWGISVGGGVAFLLILFSGFQIITSSGDPQKLQGGRELLTAAIAGLVMIIFSVFILELIGIRILQIPGF